MKIILIVAEDCGPCTQLGVDMAQREGVDPAVLQAVVARDYAAMPDDVALAVRFTGATLHHAPEADDLREGILRRWGERGLISLVFAILAVWYLGAALMNAPLQRDQFANAGRADYSTQDLVAASLNMERPKLPAPHQVASELYKLVFATSPTSKRSLVYHGLITLEETLIGFVIGSGLGIGLAALIVSMRWLERSMMPWIVA